MGSKIIALDLGNRNIKIVYGGTSKSGIIINEYEIVETPANCVRDGHIINAEELSKTILAAFKKMGIRSGNLVINITGTGVITREIQIPVSTDEEITQMLEFEAQQYFPVDLNNYSLDFKVLENYPVGDSMQSRVLIVAAPNKQVDEYIKLVGLLKQAIIAIDIPANCILKQAPYYKELLLGDEYAIIDIGMETTSVCILDKSRLKFSRILLNGSKDIDIAIANQCNVSFQKAEEIKKDFKGSLKANNNTYNEAAAVSEEVNMGYVINNALSNIVSDISRFIEFYISRNNTNRLKRLYVCGGGSLLKGLPDYFSASFSISVKPLPRTKEIEYKGKKGQSTFEADYIFLINAIGALIRL